MPPETLPPSQEKPPIVYLAVPYSHADPLVMEARYRAVTHAAGRLLAQGRHVFSPITHTHPIKVAAGQVDLWDSWAAYDTAVMTNLCSSMVVLCLKGWRTSTGVRAERQLARSLGLPISYLLPQHCGLRPRYPYQDWQPMIPDIPTRPNA